MNIPPLTRQQLRELDRRAIEQFSIPGIILMENAGAAAVRWLIELGIRGPVVISCGKGNNGGDGYVMARHLDAAGIPVHVLLVCKPLEITGDAQVQFRILANCGIDCVEWNPHHADERVEELIEHADWLVDGLLGTGLTGPVREPIASAIARLNAAPARRMAIDLPSGLDSDSGRPLGNTIRAHVTASFAASKVGFGQPNASEFTGLVRVFDIGLPRRLLQEFSAG